MPIITDPDLVKVGYYSTPCCYLDLYRIEDEGELEDVQDDLRMWNSGEDRTLRRKVWPTRREALLAIRPQFLHDEESLAEIDVMLLAEQ